MSPQQWCDHACRRLSERVAKETPAGLGGWGPAWEIVAAPTRAFEEEIRRVDAGEDRREEVKARGLEVLAAWRRAAEKWRDAERLAA